MVNNILNTALTMAGDDIPVFPVRVTWTGSKWEKRPVTANGFHGRSTDPEQIRAWFDNENGYQLAWVPADAGLVCIDVDVGANENDLQLPTTRTIRTISGGRHLYFRTDQVFGNGGWADRIDVRSGNGYTLIPPSRGYEVENPSQEVAEFPAWAAARLRAKEERQPSAPLDPDKLDLPHNVERAKAYLTQTYARVGAWGELDDPMTYDIAATVRDLGVCQETCGSLMLAYLPDTEEPWLRTTVRNAYRYAQNPEGSRALEHSATELYPSDVVEQAEAEHDAALARFMGREPDEDETLPDIAFWDDDKMLPRMLCIVIIYGDSGAHKTNLALRLCFEAMVKHGARIRFAAGEGSHGVRKARVPAQAKALGLTTKGLRGKWRTIPAVPLLSDPSQVDAFIEAQKRLGPCDIVVIDTWSTAVAGEDDNASVTAAMLTDNGPVGRIKRELGCMVIVLDHIGKMAARGVRGASAKRGNADAVLLCERADDMVVLTCEKMRDGPDGHQSFWRMSDGVPVPERCAPAALRSERSLEQNMVGQIYARLEAAGVVGVENGIDDRVLLDLIEPDQGAAERRAGILKGLRNYHRPAALGRWGHLVHSVVLPGAEKAVWRWFISG